MCTGKFRSEPNVWSRHEKSETTERRSPTLIIIQNSLLRNNQCRMNEPSPHAANQTVVETVPITEELREKRGREENDSAVRVPNVSTNLDSAGTENTATLDNDRSSPMSKRIRADGEQGSVDCRQPVVPQLQPPLQPQQQLQQQTPSQQQPMQSQSQTQPQQQQQQQQQLPSQQQVVQSSVQQQQPPVQQQQQSYPTGSSAEADALELSRQSASKRDQNWDSQFEALLAYSGKYNHCNVRPGYTVDIDEKVGVNLYAWLALQRRHKKHNKLRPDRLRKLQRLVDAAKLSWTAADSGGKAEDDDEYVHVLPPPPPPSWDCHYDALLIHAETHGTANVSVGRVVSLDGRTRIDLGGWLEDQRKAKIRNTLESLHLRRLDNLAREDKLAWHTPDPAAPSPPPVSEAVLDAQWQEKFEATKAYVTLHPQGCLGDEIDVRLRIEVPEGQRPSNPFDLFQWVRAQRMGHFYNTLKPYRRRLLQGLVDQHVFSWMSEQEASKRAQKELEKSREEAILWTAWYNALVWLGNNRGECNLNSHGTITLPDGSEAELGKWLHIQKKYIKKGTLQLERCVKLLQLMQEHKLDRGYWLKYFLLSYPPGTFAADFPELFPAQSAFSAPPPPPSSGSGSGSGNQAYSVSEI
jgi:hypothetical protein